MTDDLIRYQVAICYHASECVSVEAETPEEAEAKAYRMSEASLCHHCSDNLDLGDADGCIIEESEGTCIDTTDTAVLHRRIEELEAQIAARPIHIVTHLTSHGTWENTLATLSAEEARRAAVGLALRYSHVAVETWEKGDSPIRWVTLDNGVERWRQ